jgi:hypothetical protein
MPAISMNETYKSAMQPAVQLPEIKDLFEQITNALVGMREEVSLLDERLGYVSLSAPPDGMPGNEAMVDRSPLAHNLYCTMCDINRLNTRLNDMRNRLQI